MSEIDIYKLLVVFILEVFFCLWYYFRAKEYWDKAFVIFGLGGLFFYNGLGAIYLEVSWIYVFLFFLFQFVCYFSYEISSRSFARSSLNTYLNRRILSRSGLVWVKSDSVKNTIIFLYLIVLLIDISYPDFNLLRLIDPPSPDLRLSILSAIEGIRDYQGISKLLYYMSLLLFPFYYIALSRYRSNHFLLLFLLAFPVYIEYCQNLYVSRGMMIRVLFIYALFYFYSYPNRRLLLMLLILPFMPLLFAFFYMYEFLRKGDEVFDVSLGESLLGLFSRETEFPSYFKYVSEYAGEYFIDFVFWFFTLPFPKFGLSEIVPANYKISEIVTGLYVNDQLFFVKLTGVITESVYVFGYYFFWIEAVIVGSLAGFVVSIVKKIDSSEILLSVIIVSIGYGFARAGSSGVLPLFLNVFILFYVYLISPRFVFFYKKAKKFQR